MSAFPPRVFLSKVKRALFCQKFQNAHLEYLSLEEHQQLLAEAVKEATEKAIGFYYIHLERDFSDKEIEDLANYIRKEAARVSEGK